MTTGPRRSVTSSDHCSVQRPGLQHRLMTGAAWEAKSPWSYRRDVTRREKSQDATAIDPSAEMQTLRTRLWDGLKPMIALARSEKPSTLREIAVAVFQTLNSFG